MNRVKQLQHGGIMANYRCTASCRHCLYSCSPDRTDGYISEQTARDVCKLLKAGGCYSVHIGGGEPFLNIDGLVKLVKCIKQAGIRVEYIETNAYWATNEEQVKEYLNKLREAGANTLCISIDPFHAEYVSYDLPVSLAKICHSVDFGFFLWQERYLAQLSGLKPGIIPTRKDLENLISSRYIYNTARSYGLHLSGRAINIEAEYSQNKPLKEIINTSPCSGLLSGGHFHVDMYGDFIPPGCTGIIIPLCEAVNGIPNGKYPVFESLLNSGVAKLFEYAQDNGFVPDPSGYPSTCALCFRIRHWLSENNKSPDLDIEYYAESLKFYN